jgi:hypothetical protein
MKEMHTKFWMENLWGNHFEDLGIKKYIRMNIKGIGWEVVDWIHLS